MFGKEDASGGIPHAVMISGHALHDRSQAQVMSLAMRAFGATGVGAHGDGDTADGVRVALEGRDVFAATVFLFPVAGSPATRLVVPVTRCSCRTPGITDTAFTMFMRFCVARAPMPMEAQQVPLLVQEAERRGLLCVHGVAVVAQAALWIGGHYPQRAARSVVSVESRAYSIVVVPTTKEAGKSVRCGVALKLQAVDALDGPAAAGAPLAVTDARVRDHAPAVVTCTLERLWQHHVARQSQHVKCICACSPGRVFWNGGGEGVCAHTRAAYTVRCVHYDVADLTARRHADRQRPVACGGGSSRARRPVQRSPLDIALGAAARCSC